MKINLPATIKKYFWGDNLDDIKWPNHKKYITQTLLEKGDEKAVVWLLGKVGQTEIKQILPKLKLSEKSKNFWQLYFS